MVVPTIPRILQPLRIGAMELSSRITMAPMTRLRTNEDNTLLAFVKEYYSQRASTPGTLIISEANQISRFAGSMPLIPGIWSDAQVSAWKEVADAVHAKDSYIFLQLAGSGRAASAAQRRKDGFDLIAPSPIPMSSESPTPREMTEEEIWTTIRDFAQAAKNAVDGAGLDGVEIHGAQGYLVDQFIQDVSNQRTDSWGGSVENRSRFAVELAKAVIEAVGKDKVGFRLSPWNTYQSMRMDNPVPQFTHVIGELRKLGVAYIHLVEPRIRGSEAVEPKDSETNIPFLDAWGAERPAIVAGGFSTQSAEEALGRGGVYEGRNVAVAFGRHFTSNPDLVFRIKHGIKLAPYDRQTFYKVGSQDGYADFAFSEEFKAH